MQRPDGSGFIPLGCSPSESGATGRSRHRVLPRVSHLMRMRSTTTGRHAGPRGQRLRHQL